jgi:hypothetical protein
MSEGPPEGGSGHASREESVAFEASRSDRDRTLESLRALETTLGGAAPGREIEWLEQVLDALKSLEEVVTNERSESLRPDSILSMISRDYPRRFGSRVRQLRHQHEDIIRQIESLRSQIERLDKDAIDYGDLRRRIEWVMRAIHHRRMRETDLVYEAINLDLESQWIERSQ